MSSMKRCLLAILIGCSFSTSVYPAWLQTAARALFPDSLLSLGGVGAKCARIALENLQPHSGKIAVVAGIGLLACLKKISTLKQDVVDGHKQHTESMERTVNSLRAEIDEIAAEKLRCSDQLTEAQGELAVSREAAGFLRGELDVSQQALGAFRVRHEHCEQCDRAALSAFQQRAIASLEQRFAGFNAMCDVYAGCMDRLARNFEALRTARLARREQVSGFGPATAASAAQTIRRSGSAPAVPMPTPGSSASSSQYATPVGSPSALPNYLGVAVANTCKNADKGDDEARARAVFGSNFRSDY